MLQIKTFKVKHTRRPHQPPLRNMKLHRLRRTHPHQLSILLAIRVIPTYILTPLPYSTPRPVPRRRQDTHTRYSAFPSRRIEDLGM